MEIRATRRHFLGSGVSVSIGALLLGPVAVGASRVTRAQDQSTIVGEATPPLWRFTVRRLENPYTGELLRPEEPAAGMRYVGAEVVITNESQAPLNVASSGIRLRDADGVEYAYSSEAVLGTEPRLRDINMLPGELAAGWIWFAVPETASLVELVYVAPTPRLAVVLGGPAAAPPSGAATPTADD